MQENTQNNVIVTTLPPAERAVIALDSKKAEQQLRELVAKSAGITTVIDKDGREEAHRAGMTLKNARLAISKVGKTAREDAQAFSAAVIAEEKRLIAITQVEEDRVFSLRDAFDAEQARIKAEKERIERERVVTIGNKISAIRRLSAESFRASAHQIAATVGYLEAIEVSESNFAEFAGEAAAAKGQALVDLRDLLAKAQSAEAEAARLAAERAELARLREEAAERERAAAAERAEAERIAAAARKAEEDRLRAEREAFEAERRAFAEQQAAAARAEQERIDAERRAAEEAEAAARAAEQARIAAERAEQQRRDDEAAEAARQEQEAAAPAPAAEQEPIDDQGRIACLDLVVGDLLTMGFTADDVRALVERSLAAAKMKEAA